MPACNAGTATEDTVLAAATAQAPDQHLAFARSRVAKMVGHMAAGPTAAACAEVLEKTGRECARLGGLPARFKGDPECCFATARKNWGTDFSWDKEKRIISEAVAEGECGCPRVDAKRTPAFWCNCSVGYQKEALETVFGRPVEAVLKASKLSGSPWCVFEVTLA